MTGDNEYIEELAEGEPKMEKEFNLSEYEIRNWGYHKQVVKKFIKLRREDLHAVNRGEMNLAMALARLKFHAGSKLI